MISRSFLGAALILACLTPAVASEAAPASREERLTLQQRLTDAGCYSGAVDGEPSAALDDAIKQCPDMRPFLRIETSMHTAMIKRIGVDAACSRAATASDDKTVRLWSLPDGKLQRTFRLPIGDGNNGKVFATALSPDGRWLAAGGYDASWDKSSRMSLTLIDLNSGALRRLGELESTIDSLAFSVDGARVAVGLYRTGLRVFEVASGREVLADRDYGDSIYGLAFAADGALVVSSYDGKLRRYGPDLSLTAQRAAPQGKQPYGVAIDPSGRRLAVGYDDTTKVSLLDAVTLKPIGEADTKGVSDGDFSSVSWSGDGATLIAGGQAQELFAGAWRRFFRRFDAKGRQLRADIAAADNTLMDVRPCGDGFVFAAGDPAFGRISAAGRSTTLQGPRTSDMRDKLSDAFALAADAATVRFGLGDRGQAPVVFDLAAATLADAPERPNHLASARVDGLPVTDWMNNDAPKFAGRTIALEPHETSRALAVRPDAAGFALGTEWYVRVFDAQGQPRWQTPGPDVAWGVDFSADGALLAVAYGDGTVRWLRWSDGQELLALFVEPPTKRWVAWTPSGYYMASPGGEELIGWHLNRGWSQLADFYPASQFSKQFNRPDVVQLVLNTRDEAEAVRQADEKSRRKAETASVAAALPPVVTILSPADGATFSGDSVEVTFSLRSPTGQKIDKVEALIDGRPVETRGLAPAGAGDTQRLTIPLPPRAVEIALIAHAGPVTSAPARAKLTFAGPAADAAAALKPKLYAVTIGVSDYVDSHLQLEYADADAKGFAEALIKQKGGLYGDVQIKTLTNREATRATILDALSWLEGQVGQHDLGVVLIAGHGYLDERSRFWFLPADVDLGRLRASAVSKDEIQSTMGVLAGKAMLFLDTCHANGAVTGEKHRSAINMNSVVQEFSATENGVITFAAAQGFELSEERSAWRHGAFTKALIEGVEEGKADFLHNGAITTAELDAYVANRVKELTDGHQHPVMHRPDTVPDFPFAMAH